MFKIILQCDAPNPLQSQFRHTGAAFNYGVGMTEVVIFGGCPEWPSNSQDISPVDIPRIADTTVLRFSKSTPSF